VVYSATGRSELRRIPHVPLLPLLRWRINKILETTQVTTTDSHHAIEEEEEAMESEAEDGSVVEDDEGGPTGGTGSPADGERL